MIIITNNTYKTLYREAVTEFINAKYYNNRLSSYDNLEEAVLKSKIQNESLQDVANSFICVPREEIEALYKKLPVDKTLIDLYKKKCEAVNNTYKFLPAELLGFLSLSFTNILVLFKTENKIILEIEFNLYYKTIITIDTVYIDSETIYHCDYLDKNFLVLEDFVSKMHLFLEEQKIEAAKYDYFQ